jgi:L-lactate dehydrogenase
VKVGVVGVGAVGAATALSLIERGGMCREIVVVDRAPGRADGVASDLRAATPLSPTVDVRAGDYHALGDAAVVILTAGVNEKAGGATDRSDPQGRRLLDTNARVYAEIVPKVVAAAPGAVLMVVTDPPDPLADLTRRLAGHDRVFSTGTLLDSLRFRVQLADRLRVRPRDVQAMVVGEHGTSEVLLWSSASVGGVPVLELLGRAVSPSSGSGSRSRTTSGMRTSPSSRAPGRASTVSARCRRGWPRRCCATSARSCRWPPTRHATR